MFIILKNFIKVFKFKELMDRFNILFSYILMFFVIVITHCNNIVQYFKKWNHMYCSLSIWIFIKWMLVSFIHMIFAEIPSRCSPQTRKTTQADGHVGCRDDAD